VRYCRRFEERPVLIFKRICLYRRVNTIRHVDFKQYFGASLLKILNCVADDIGAKWEATGFPGRLWKVYFELGCANSTTRGRSSHSDKQKFRSDLNRSKGCEMSERLLKTLRRSGDFQAEYTPAVLSNDYDQRMSVSVVASPGFEPTRDQTRDRF
jgi:hypothetical protein